MKSKSILGIFAFIIAIVALSVLTYLAQKTIGVSDSVALGVSGVVLISGVACLISKSNEKRVVILSIGIGFAARALVAYFLAGFGINRFLSALVGNLLLVVIIVTGFLLSAPLARRLRSAQPQRK